MTNSLREIPPLMNTVGGGKAEIDEALIENLVRTFYDRVRADAVLGPIFAAKITDDWEPHLQTMMAFWSSVMLTSGRFKGRPMEKHQALPNIQPEHFSLWLALFEATARDVCHQNVAENFVRKAQQIAISLQRGLGLIPFH